MAKAISTKPTKAQQKLFEANIKTIALVHDRQRALSEAKMKLAGINAKIFASGVTIDRPTDW